MKKLLLSVAMVSFVTGQASADVPLRDDDFVMVSSTLKFTPQELDNYVEQEIARRAFQKKVDAGEIILASDPDRHWKLGVNIAKKTVGVAFDVFAPVAAQLAVRATGDVAINYLAPLFVDYTGKAAAGMASKASSWWTQYDPTGFGDKFVRGAAKATARGEAYRDIGILADYVQKYAAPVAKSTYRAGKAIASGTISMGKKFGHALTNGYHSAKTRFSAWFGKSQAAAAA